MSRHAKGRTAVERFGLRRPARAVGTDGGAGDPVETVESDTAVVGELVADEGPGGDTDTPAAGSGNDALADNAQAPTSALDESNADSEDIDDFIAEAGRDGVTPTVKPLNKWSRAVVYGLLPALALLLAVTSAYLKWQDSTIRPNEAASVASIQAAKDSTVAILSYQPNTVEQQLGSARDLLTGEFRDAYTQLTNDVVIPGSKQKQISVVATVPAVASVSADEKHAVALVFVNQTTVIGKDAPSDSTSSVRVTMDNVDGRWLISKFDPV